MSKGYSLFDEINRKLYFRRDVEFTENNFGQRQAMTTESDQKGEEWKKKEEEEEKEKEKEKKKKKKKTCRKNLEGLKEHEKHLSDMFTMNKQTLQLTTCTMSFII